MKVLQILTISLLIFACTDNRLSIEETDEPVHEKLLNGRFDAYESTLHCDCGELDKDSTATYKKQDSLFTGVCTTTYPGSELKMEEKQIFEGKLHGNYRIYSKEGDTLTTTLYFNGELDGVEDQTPSTCACDELENQKKASEKEIALKTYNGIPYTGTCKQFYPGLDSTQVYMEIPYLDGYTEGKMIIYSKDGKPLMMQQYEKGVELDQVTFSN